MRRPFACLRVIHYVIIFAEGIDTLKCPECDALIPDGTGYCGSCGIHIRTSRDEPAPITQTLATPSAHLSTGFSFAGRYQIIEELGQGGMGTVYRAYDQKLSEEVALKLIKPEIATDHDTVLRFSNEVKLARKISHRNIGNLYELMEDEGTHYITMEYISGEDLRRLQKRIGSLPQEKALHIAAQICEGLSEAHSLGIVHRDLKPGNIQIDHNGNVRILDFGIARSLGTPGMTQKGIAVGTPEYMSPEQVDGQPADERSDIYSLGVICYEMLTGKRPFEGNSPFSIGYKHKMEPPQNPRLVDPRIPEELSRCVLKCLEKQREDRYQSAAEILADLSLIRNQLSGTGLVRPEKSRRPPSRQLTVRINLRRLLIPAIILAAAAVIVILVFLL
ncbi:MAG: serine/threonine protein kinase [Candidatus Aminicenantaceae bacterium]